MAETASWHEWLRLVLALAGIVVAFRGRALVLGQVFRAPLGTPPALAHALRDVWDDDMALAQAGQWSVLGVHALLLLNVATNLFYPSAPLEQPNVATSNIMQVVVPTILIRFSELISSWVRTRARAATAAAIDHAETAS